MHRLILCLLLVLSTAVQVVPEEPCTGYYAPRFLGNTQYVCDNDLRTVLQQSCDS